MEGFDFIPIVGLQGVTMYHPLAAMGQFCQTQDFHSFARATDYRLPLLSSMGNELLRMYDLWDHREPTSFRNGHLGQTLGY